LPGKGEPLGEDEELMEYPWFTLPSWKKKKADKLNNKPPKATTEIRVMEVSEKDIMQEVDFVLAESYDDLIGCLPTKSKIIVVMRLMKL